MSLYIVIGLAFEERALRREFGLVYELRGGRASTASVSEETKNGIVLTAQRY
jgi:hypothetical protein